MKTSKHSYKDQGILPSPYAPPSDVYVRPPSFSSREQSESLTPVLPWAPPPPGYEYVKKDDEGMKINWTEIALIASTGLIVFLAMK